MPDVNANLIALFAGLVFVSHPVQIEAVTYIWQRAASMATMFYVASLCFYVQSRLLQAKKSTSGYGRAYYVLSLITAMVAMITKETALTLPLLILLYEFTFLKDKGSLNWRALSPFLLTIFIIPSITLFTNSEKVSYIHGSVNVPGGISPWQYVLTQFRVMVTYIRLFFLPLNQNIDYDYHISKSIFELPALFSFLFLIAILFSAQRLFSKYKLISFSILWFFLTSLPEAIPFPVKDVIFEHRLYLPLVGYSMFLVSGVYYLIGKKSIIAMVMALTVIVAFNSILTYQRNKVWKDEFTLWDDAVRKSPHKARPYNNRAKTFFEQGNLNQAMSDFSKAIDIEPDNRQIYINRSSTYIKQGNFTQAIADCNKAIAIDPRYPEPYNIRGSAYSNQGDFTRAVSDFNKAIEINPNYAEAYNNRSMSYSNQNNFTQAISDCNKAIALKPGYADAYNNCGRIYDKQGIFIQAIPEYSKAIALNPEDAQAYTNRGISYAKKGDFADAASDFTKAIEINPKYADAYIDSGLIDEKKGNLAGALLMYSKAIDINPDYAEAYLNRGNIYAQEKNFTQAISDYNKVNEINPHDMSVYNNRAISYYQLKEYDKAWADVRKAEESGVAVNPKLINALKEVTASGGTSSQER